MRFYLFLLVALAGAVITAIGCGGGSDSTSITPGGDSDGGGNIDATAFRFGDAALGGDVNGGGHSDARGIFVISPSTLQTVTVAVGGVAGAVTFSATLNGVPVAAGWSIDRGDLAAMAAGPSATATLTPSGTTGGVVTVTAGFNGQKATAQVLIKLTAQQNGPNAGNAAEQAQLPTDVSQLTAGGGVGGVGGEGLGVAVADPGTLSALQNPAGDAGAQSLAFLYPYDKTVWPRGTAGASAHVELGARRRGRHADFADDDERVVLVDRHLRQACDLAGRAGAAGVFIRHPIPQDVWEMATNTAGGVVNGQSDQLTVKLTVAKGGVGVRPDRGDLARRARPAPGHHLLQLLRHAAREEQRRRRGNGRRRGRNVRRRRPLDPRGRHGTEARRRGQRRQVGVPRLPLRRGRRVDARRPAWRRLRRLVGL